MDKDYVVKQAEHDFLQQTSTVKAELLGLQARSHEVSGAMTDQSNRERISVIQEYDITSHESADDHVDTEVDMCRQAEVQLNSQKANANLSPKATASIDTCIKQKTEVIFNLAYRHREAMQQMRIDNYARIHNVNTAAETVIVRKAQDITDSLGQQINIVSIDQLTTITLQRLEGLESVIDQQFDSLSRLISQCKSTENNLRSKQINELHAVIQRTVNQLTSMISRSGNQHTQRQERAKRAYQQSTGHAKIDSQKPKGQKVDRYLNDPRITVISGRGDSTEDRRPCITFLKNLDHFRQQGKSDAEIFKMMVRHFHPDRSERSNADAVIRVVTRAYDRSSKRFTV